MNELPPGINLSANRALGVLDRNLSLRLGDGDDARDDHDQQSNSSTSADSVAES